MSTIHLKVVPNNHKQGYVEVEGVTHSVCLLVSAWDNQSLVNWLFTQFSKWDSLPSISLTILRFMKLRRCRSNATPK